MESECSYGDFLPAQAVPSRSLGSSTPNKSRTSLRDWRHDGRLRAARVLGARRSALDELLYSDSYKGGPSPRMDSRQQPHARFQAPVSAEASLGEGIWASITSIPFMRFKIQVRLSAWISERYHKREHASLLGRSPASAGSER